MNKSIIPKKTIEEYLKLSSSTISDAMDLIGVSGILEGIAPQVPGKKICGPAYTVRYTSMPVLLSRFADFLDDVPPGAVVAIDNSARTDTSVWGDTLSYFATMQRFAGTVIDGVCRDIDGTRKLNYPLYSRGTFVRSGKGRIGIESTQEPITIGGVIVRPCDLIFGDDTGLVAVPRDRIDEVLKLTKRIVARDEACWNAIADGASMKEAWFVGANVKGEV